MSSRLNRLLWPQTALITSGMTRNWFWPLLAGLLIGIAAGFALTIQDQKPKASAFLLEFSFHALATNAGQVDWKVIEDKIYNPFPSSARQKRIARRIIAHAP